MGKKDSKKEVKEKIEDFFKEIGSQSPKEIKKIKKLAMSYKISLKEYRKTFCKKCFSSSLNSKIRIKNGQKIITCNECQNISRYKLKN